MRTAALAFFFVAFTLAANGQKFSLLPQVGFENSKTIIQYNDLNGYAPLGVKFSPQASLRLNYTSKQGQGFFVGVATSRSVVSYSFTNPETAFNDFIAVAGNMKVRFESGYQFTSPKINLSKAKSTPVKQTARAGMNRSESSSYGRCGRSYSCQSRCGKFNKSRAPEKVTTKAASWVRIQPSIGLGLMPGAGSSLFSKTSGAQTAYEYSAGNWSTALITGANIEFGKGNRSVISVGVNYFNSNGLNKQTITTSQGNKTTTTILRSDVSGWNVRVGVPISFNKTSSSKNKSINKEKPHNRCGGYYRVYRCGGRSI